MRNAPARPAPLSPADTDVTPSAAYAAGIASGRWRADAAQQAALDSLDRIHACLARPERAGPISRLARRLRRPDAVRGLYLWGGVGRGKTFLVDLLFEHAPVRRKRRVHFHRFMAEVHGRLEALDRQSDPLDRVAGDLAAGARLLVLDEFFVSDIGDAMILARLLEGLFSRGVTLVTTSNIAPPGLYRDGLQRARFEPAIALIQQHCEVREMDGGRDYRLHQLTAGGIYHQPLDATAEAAMASAWERLTRQPPSLPGPLRVNDRSLQPRAMADGSVWFDFAELCEGPRAVADYIELARDFHTLLLSGVPGFDERSENAARRFVHLVDELYDRHVNLVVSAACPPTGLYRGERLAREFERTGSRLVEMQSDAYLALGHRH